MRSASRRDPVSQQGGTEAADSSAPAGQTDQERSCSAKASAEVAESEQREAAEGMPAADLGLAPEVLVKLIPLNSDEPPSAVIVPKASKNTTAPSDIAAAKPSALR